MPPMWAPPLIFALLGTAEAVGDSAAGNRPGEEKDWHRALCDKVVDISQSQLDFTLRAGFIPPPEADSWNTIFEQHLPLEPGKGWYRIKVWFQTSLTDSTWRFCYLYYHRADNWMQWHHPFGSGRNPAIWAAQESANTLCQLMEFDGALHYFQNDPAPSAAQSAGSAVATSGGTSQTQAAWDKSDPWTKSDPWSKRSSWTGGASSQKQDSWGWKNDKSHKSHNNMCDWTGAIVPSDNTEGDKCALCPTKCRDISAISAPWLNGEQKVCPLCAALLQAITLHGAVDQPIAATYFDDACKWAARILCTIKSASSSSPPHNNMGTGLLRFIPLLIRRPDYRSKRYNDAYAHVQCSWVTATEHGALLSMVKWVQGQSVAFMEWWHRICGFYYGGILDPTRLPITLLLQALSTQHAIEVTNGAYTRGWRALRDHNAIHRESILERIGGVPTDVPNPDDAGNPIHPSQAPIPFNHSEWSPPSGLPSCQLVPPKDDVDDAADLIEWIGKNSEVAENLRAFSAQIASAYDGQPPSSTNVSDLQEVRNNAPQSRHPPRHLTEVFTVATDMCNGLSNPSRAGPSRQLADLLANQGELINAPFFGDRPVADQNLIALFAMGIANSITDDGSWGQQQHDKDKVTANPDLACQAGLLQPWHDAPASEVLPALADAMPPPPSPPSMVPPAGAADDTATTPSLAQATPVAHEANPQAPDQQDSAINTASPWCPNQSVPSSNSPSAPEAIPPAADSSQPAATPVTHADTAAPPTTGVLPVSPQHVDTREAGSWLGHVGSHLAAMVMPGANPQAPITGPNATETSPDQPERTTASPVAPPTEPLAPVEAPPTQAQLACPPQADVDNNWRGSNWNHAADWSSRYWGFEDTRRRRNPWRELL